jgi:XTP/dITP diphosphohydrolase
VRSNGEGGILREREATVYFATGNRVKYIEAAQLASIFGISLKRLTIDKLEIQSDDLQDISSFAAKKASETTRRAVVTEDAGFFVDALGGFPGPYSSYVFRTVGVEGILSLLRGFRNRNASFRATVAFCRPRARPICFNGLVAGVVSRKPKGNYGFGFDPIFKPNRADGRTFAEMKTKEKNLFSHRAEAFAKFFTWFTVNGRRIPA